MILLAIACVSPVAFGAVVRDGIDDRAALQAAWDVACSLQQPLCLPEGRLEVSRRPLAGAANIGSLQLTCAGAGYVTSCRDDNGQPIVGMEVYGVGANRTSVNLLGSATFPGSGPRPSWTLINPHHIDGLCLHDFAVTGDRRGSASEQTHLLEVTGPAANIAVERMTFFFPQSPFEQGNDEGGDCVRTVGSGAAPVRGVFVRDSSIGPCYRTALIFQRGTSHVLVERVSARPERNKQALDMEASAGGDVTGITVRDSSFSRQPGVLGPTVAFDGVGDGSIANENPITGVLFADVTIEDGGLLLDDVSAVDLRRVSIDSGQSQSPTMQVLKGARDVTCTDCRIRRPAGAPSGEVVKSYRQERTPHDLKFVRGSIRADGMAFLLYAEGLDELRLEGTALIYTGPATGAGVLKLRGLAALSDPRLVSITGADVRVGAARGLLDVVVSTGGSGGVLTLRRNDMRGAAGTYDLSLTGTATSVDRGENTLSP